MALNLDDPRPPYIQVAEELRAAITAGQLKPGDRLPSARDLVQRYRIASMTAQNALRVLRDQGLIYSVPGRGSFVRHRPQPEHDAHGEHSQEYQTVMRQLEAMTDDLHRLADRVAQLEDLAQKNVGRAPKRAR